jgi:hypothetical protein
MRVATLLRLAACAALFGCAHPTTPLRDTFKEPLAGVGEFFPSPDIARVKTADQYQVTYDYARMTGSALPFAIEAAQRGCSPSGKRAHIVGMGLRTRERGWVTFECI